jgi:hypothetical protein
MEQSLQRVVTDLTEVKLDLSPDVNLKQEFSEFKDRWDSGSPDVQNLKASLEKLKSSLGGLTGMLTAPADAVATEVETEVVTAISDKPVVQHIETTIKPAVKIVRVQDQDESDAGIEMGKTTTTGLPPMWQGKTVGVKAVQENADDGLPAVRFAIGDRIVDKK